MDTTRVSARTDAYWAWLAVALFLLVTVDLLTTFGAVARFGIGAEANPIVAELLRGPMWLLVGVHLGVVFAVAYGFEAVLRLFRRTPPRLRPVFAAIIETWLVLLVLFGIALSVNNLSVLFFGVNPL